MIGGNTSGSELATFDEDGDADNDHTFSVKAGETSADVTVYINDNSANAVNDPITLTLSKGEHFPEGWGEVSSTANTYTLTVTDDDAPSIGFAEPDSAFFEGATGDDKDIDIELEVGGVAIPELGIAVPMGITGSVSTVLGEVQYNGNDLQAAVGGSLTVLPGTNPGDKPRFTLQLEGDGDLEPGGTVTFTLDPMVSVSVNGGTMTLPSDPAARTHELTIEPSDGEAFFLSSADEGSVDEDVADGTATFRVSLSVAAPSTGLPLELVIVGNTPGSELVTFDENGGADNDYAFSVGAGETSEDITVYIINNTNDAIDNEQEIVFTLSQGEEFPEGWGRITPGSETYTLTVVDDEVEMIGFKSDESEAMEGLGTVSFPVPVTLTSALASSFELRIDVVESEDENAARSGQLMDNDFRAPATLSVLDVGDTNFVVEILSDTTAELDETIVLRIPDEADLPPNFVLGPHAEHTVTIVANDNNVTFLPLATDRIAEDRGSTVIRVTIDRPIPEGEVATIDLAPTSADGITADDYMLSVPAGEGGITGTTWTLPTQQTTASLTITAVNNSRVEPHKTLTLGLSPTLPRGWRAVSIPSYDITFLNEDREAIGFVSGASSANEDSSNNTTFNVPLMVPVTPSAAFDINVGVASRGSAVAGEDFTVEPTFEVTGPGDEIEVTILSDGNEPEDDKTVVLEISAPSGFPDEFYIDSSRQEHIITILANENTVGFASDAPTSVVEGDTGVNIRIEASHDAPGPDGLALRLEIMGDAASFSDNGLLSMETVTINAGQDHTATPIYFPVDGDADPDEVTLTLTADPAASSPFPTAWGAAPNVMHKITVNEPTSVGGTIEFAAAESPAMEPGSGGGTRTHTVNINVDGIPPAPADAFDLTVTVAGTAVPGSGNDYVSSQLTQLPAAASPVSISSGNTGINAGVLSLNFDIREDGLPEARETIILTLSIDSGDSKTAGWTLGAQTTHTVNIAAHDNVFTLTPSSASVDEGGGEQIFSLGFHNPLDEQAVLRINASGTGITEDDFTITPRTSNVTFSKAADNSGGGTLTLDAGTGPTVSFGVAARADNRPEYDETLTLALDGTHSDAAIPDGWAVGASGVSGNITIPANENIIKFADSSGANQKTSTTPETGTHNVPLYVNLPHTGRDIVLDVTARENGSNRAERGSDYSVLPQVTILAGESTENISIVVTPDDRYEQDETIELVISSETLPDGWSVDPDNNTHTVTITNDDAEPPSGTVGFAPNGTATAAEGETVSLGVVSTAAPGAGSTLSFGWEVSPAGEVDVATGTVEISGTSPNGTFSIEVDRDGVPEDNENIMVTLIDTDQTDLFTLDGTADTHTIAIPANENTVTFATNNPSSVPETDATATLNIALTNPAPSGGLALSIAAEGDTSAVSFDEIDTSAITHDFIIPEGGGASTPHPVTVYINPGASGADDVTFKLTSRSGFPDAWGSVPSDETHDLRIAEPGAPVAGTVAFVRPDSTAEEPAPGATKSHPVEIVTTGVLPPGGFHLTVTADTTPVQDSDTSTADTNDYTVAQTLSSISVTQIGKFELDFTIADDDIPEAEESVTLTISSNGLPNGWNPGTPASHTIVIPANDSFVGFSDEPVELTEQAGFDRIPVKLNAPGPQAIMLLVSITGGEEYDGTPIPAGDITNEVTFVPLIGFDLTGTDDEPATEGYQETIYISIRAKEDSMPENEETFSMRLRTTSGADNIPGFDTNFERTFTVPAHDNTVTFEDAPPGTVNEQGSAQTVNLKFTNPVPEDYTVSITQNGGDNGDLTISRDSITIDRGENTASFTVTANDDLDTISETVTLTLGSSQTLRGWEVPPGTTHDIEIIDNDVPTGTIGFVAAATPDAAEPGTGQSVYNVELAITNTEGTLASPDTLPLMLTIVPGMNLSTASGGDVHLEETIRIASADFTGGLLNYPVTVFADEHVEEDETVTIRLTDAGLPPGWRLGATKEHVVTIPRNDQPVAPVIGFAAGRSGATVPEPPAGTASVLHNVPLALTVAPSANITVAFTFSTTNGADRDEVNGDYSAALTHEIQVSDITNLEAFYPVSVLGDAKPELLESFTIGFADNQPGLPPGWTVDTANSSYLVEIPANDNTVKFASTSTRTITELAGTNHSVDIDIKIEKPLPSGTNATVAIMQTAGTADQNDYTITGTGYSGGVLTLPEASQDTATITVTATGRDGNDAGESFELGLANFSNVDGWSIDTGETVTILIEDDTPAVTGTVGFAPTSATPEVNLASVAEGDDLTLTVLASAAPDMDIPVAWEVTSGAGDVDSGTRQGGITIKATETSATFVVTALNDNATVGPEADEEITVTLSGGLINGFTFGDKEHVFTIPANEQHRIGFETSGPVSVIEGDSVTLKLLIRGAAGEGLAAGDITGDIPLTFAYREVDGQGGHGDDDPDTTDDSPVSFTVTTSTGVSGGVLEVSPQVTIDDDETVEGRETVSITLGMGENFPGEWRIDDIKTFWIDIPANDAPVVENKIGFAQTTIDLYQGESQVVKIREAADTVFPQDINLLATISNTDVVRFRGASAPYPPFAARLVQNETFFDLPALESVRRDGSATISLSVPDSETLPLGWGLDETRSVLTVNNYIRTVAFARVSSEAFFTADTVTVRLNLGAPAPQGLMVSVSTDDTGTITLPPQPMPVAQGARFHEFDVTIVDAAKTSKVDKTVALSLVNNVAESNSANQWGLGLAGHNLNLRVPDMVLFESFASAQFNEDAGTVPVRLHLTSDAPNDFSVNLALADASRYGGDVSVVADSSPTFRGGSRSATINLTITDDSEKEFFEEVGFTLAKGTDFPAEGWVLDETSYRLFIIDNDGDANGVVSFASTNPSSLPEDAGLSVLGLSLGDGSGGSGTVPEGGMGLTLTSSDPGRVAIPERWASFTLPAGITTGTFLFTVDVLGEDGDNNTDTVTLTLGRGTDGTFPAGWRIATERQSFNIVDATRVVGFAAPTATDGSYDNFDEENFRINVAESSGTVLLPIRTNLGTQDEGGLPLTVTIAQGGDVFSFTDAPGMTSYNFAIPKGEKEYNLEITVQEDADTNIDVGRFLLSLGANPPDDFQNEVTRNEITVWSIDDDGEEGFVIFEEVTESPFGSPVEYFEPRLGDADADTDDRFNALAVTRYVNLLFSALPRPTTMIPEPGFNLETTFSSPGTAGATINTAPGGVSAPDVRLPTTTFIPMDEILIRPGGFLYRLPITVFSDSEIVDETERENFRLEIVKNQAFPPGIAGRRIPYAHVGTIVDRSGGQIGFVENNHAPSGGETRNPGTVDEDAGTINVRVNTTRTSSAATPLKWRVERAVDADGHELSSSGWEDDLGSVRGDFTIPANMNFADFTLSITDDAVVEGDETYTLILEEGTGFSSARGSRIVPGKNRYTFTITDNDAAIDTVFGFAGARTEVAAEDGSEITISFSLTEDGTEKNSLIPAGGICLILETAGTTPNDDVFHLDTSRSAATTSPATPNCEPTRGTSGAVDAAVGASVLAEYIPAGQAPDMRLRINDDTDPEIKEEITFTIRAQNNGLPDGWRVGRNTHTVAIAANDNLISFAEKTSSVTENSEDMPDQPAKPGHEVSINITQAVPAEEIVGTEKKISLQVEIETLNGDPADGDDITLAVASSAGGSSVFDPATGILTVNAGINEVPLVITVVDDEILNEFGEQVAITLSKVAGVDLPRGWVVDMNDGNNVHTVSVADDDFIFVQFAEDLKDGFTINENANWLRREFVERTGNAVVPKDPAQVASGRLHKTFSVRLRVDDTDPQFNYVGITEERGELVTYDPGKTFREQGFSQTTLDFYNNGFGSSLHLRNGVMSIRTSDNPLSEGPQDVTLFLEVAPGSSLPPGWRIGPRNTLTVTVNDNENFIRWDENNPKEFTEGQGAVELRLYASAGGVTIGRAPPAGSGQINNSFAQLRLPGSPDPLPRTIGFNKTSGSFGVQFPPNRFATGGPQDIHYNDVYVPFDGSGGHTKVIASRHFAVNDSSTRPKNENNGQGYTLFIGEDENFTNDVLVYEIYQVTLSNGGWGQVLGHPLRWEFTVKDNDRGGIISFAESESSVAEAGSVPVTISIVQPLQVESGVLLNLSSSTGDAVYGTDYTITGTGGAVYDSNTSVLTLPAGMEEVTFTVQTMEDSVAGDLSSNFDKNFTITLGNPPSPNNLPSNWSVSSTKNTHAVTIVNNEVQFGFAQQSTAVSKESARDVSVDIELQVTGATVPAGGFRIPMEISGFTPGSYNYNVLEQAEHNGSTLEQIVLDGDEPQISANPGGNPRLTVTIPMKSGSDPDSEPGGTITFTLPPELTSVSGASRTHELKIEPHGGSVFFTDNDKSSSVSEDAGSTTVRVSLNIPAPSGGLPLKLRIVDSSGMITTSDLVTFNMNGTPNNSVDFSIPEGHASWPVTVYINDNSDAEDNPQVFLALSQGDNNFPTEWGVLVEEAKTHTLTVNSEDPPTIGFAKTDTQFFSKQRNNFDIELEVKGYTVAASFQVTLQVAESAQEMLQEVWYDRENIEDNLSGGSGDFDVRPGVNQGNPRITLGANTSASNANPGDTLTFTLPDSATVTANGTTTTLTADASAKTHTLTLEPSGGFAWFDTGANMSIVSEDAGSAKFSLSLNGVPAPSTGLPLKLDITSGNGDNLVTFNSDGTIGDSVHPFSVTAGAMSHEFTVYIRNNTNAATNSNQEVVFTILPDDNFPTDWGDVASLAGSTYTLTVLDDESPTIGFMSEKSTHLEGTVARIPLVFANYTIPSGGIALKFDVAGTARGDQQNPDVQHNGGDVVTPFTVNLGASDTAISIDIRDDGGGSEKEETLVLTLRDSDGLPSGAMPGEITKHTITIPANNNDVFFKTVPNQSMATVTEGPMVEATITVSLTNGAPEGGLPLKFDIVDDSGNITTSSLVTFNRDRTTLENSSTFEVLPGPKSHEVTVYIIDNNDDADPEEQIVKFKLSEDTGFPTGWGSVRTPPEGTDIFTLTIIDDDLPTSGSAPPRLPDPVRPPRQETSPKSPDEFQKEAKANP